MNGLVAVQQLLHGASDLTDLVPVERIVTGILPQDIQLPAVAVTDVSSTDLQTHDEPGTRFTVDRVQATVLAATYASLVSVLKAVKNAGDAKYPVVSGLINVVVRTDGQGPFFTNEQASIQMRSQDFRVSYTH